MLMLALKPPASASIILITFHQLVSTAYRALGNCGQVFRYAVATGRAERDPSGDLRGALPPVKGTHFASVTEPKQVAGVLRALDGYEGTLPVCCALRCPAGFCPSW